MATFRVKLSTENGDYSLDVEADDAVEAEWHAINEVQQDEPGADPKVTKASRRGVNLKRGE